MADSRYTVLGRGESYQEVTEIGRGGGAKKAVRSFEQAAELLLPQVHRAMATASEIPRAARLDEVVFEIRMHRDFVAKSYLPRELIENAHLTLRGTGRWYQHVQERRSKREREEDKRQKADAVVPSRSLFVSGRPESVELIASVLRGQWGGNALQSEVTWIEEIRVPTNEDRFRGTFDSSNNTTAIELVLFHWDRVRSEEAIRRVSRFSSPDNVRTKRYVDGPTFIAAVVPTSVVNELGAQNFVRAARPLLGVDLTRTVIAPAMPAPPPPSGKPPKAWVAVFDGGCAAPHAHLDPYVIATDATTAPPVKALVEHGTAVCSAAVYGPITPGKGVLADPEVGVFSYRVLPDSKNVFELYGVIDALEAVVPTLPSHVRVVNLSLGPHGPIDDAPSRFTYAIDRLAYESERLFFVAVGNWGDKAGLERIQAPADTVNGFGVGAWTVDPMTGTISAAPYSCAGPGRSGCARKPDFLMNGGSAVAPLFVLDASAGTLVGTAGTSFASPQGAATAAKLLAQTTPKITTQAARALLLNACKPLPNVARAGWGMLPSDPDEILKSDTNRISVLYEAVLTPRVSWKLPFFLPAGLALDGNVGFSWTFVFAPDVDGNSYDEYTLGGLEIQFRANKRIFSYTHPTKRNVYEKLHDVDDSERIAELLAAGWTKALQPVANSRRNKNEHTRRAAEAKWDTVVRGEVGKRAAMIDEPFLTLSMLGRGEWDKQDPSIQARFAAVLNVHAPKYTGDLYAKVTQTFTRLQPLRVQVPAIVQVHTGPK